jgi:predicted Zn-dependent protease
MAKTLVLTMVLAYGSAAHAQPAPRADPAGQLALVEAQFTAWRAAVTELLDHSDVKALRLKPVEVEAYTAVLVETTDPRPRLDLAETARRMAALRKDQDASYDIADTWTGMQRLHEQLAAAASRERAQMIDDLRAKHLAALASAALARTEESVVGGRAPSDEGRLRAHQLTEAALALAPDSPDAHEVMGDILIDASDPETAEAEFRKALAGDNSASIRTKLAEALRLQGKFQDAITELREAIRREPGFARAHSGLGLVLRAA